MAEPWNSCGGCEGNFISRSFFLLLMEKKSKSMDPFLFPFDRALISRGENCRPFAGESSIARYISMTVSRRGNIQRD